MAAALSDAQDEGRIEEEPASFIRVLIAQAAQDWPAMAAALDQEDKARIASLAAPAGKGMPPRSESAVLSQLDAERGVRVLAPLRVLALARTGRPAAARALSASLPLDCAACLRARAEVESAAGAWALADGWYARAVAFAPTVPQGDTLWGQSLLARGDATGAIAKFAAAHAKGPRFADPLEGWGEALLARGDPEGASARFAEAARLAPRWGRLHLKWGEALAKQGKAAEAKAQFTAAAGLDLTTEERAELAVQKA